MSREELTHVFPLYFEGLHLACFHLTCNIRSISALYLCSSRASLNLSHLKLLPLECPLWHSGNESDWYPRGCGFDPWPCSVGRGSSVAMSCGVGHRRGSDHMLLLLWLWWRLAATAPIGPLAWEFPYAMGVALKSKKMK